MSEFRPNTWSSINQELAASIPPEARTGLRGAPGKKDHALFSAISALKPAQLREALSNVCFVVGLVLFAISGPLAIITFFIMLFIEF